MPLPVEVADLADRFHSVLGSRLVGFAMYGSTVTGDFLPGVSDLDLLVVVDGAVGLPESTSLHRAFSQFTGDWCRIQVSYLSSHDLGEPRLVPGAFVAHNWIPPVTLLHTDRTLRRSGERWLKQISRIAESDLADWSVCSVADEPIMARLVFTRIKPTIRATVVDAATDALTVWRSRWDDLNSSLATMNSEVAELSADMIAGLHTRRRLTGEDVPTMLSITKRLAAGQEPPAAPPV